MKTVLWKCSSTNGRHGVEIVGEDEYKPLFDNVKHRAIPGAVTALGRRSGFACFAYKASTDFFLVIEEEAEVVEAAGAALVHQESLQSGGVATLLHVAPLGVWKWVGYKGRESGYRLVKADGSIEGVPTSLLLDAGIVQPAEPPPPAPAPPAFGSSFADALRRAGLGG